MAIICSSFDCEDLGDFLEVGPELLRIFTIAAEADVDLGAEGGSFCFVALTPCVNCLREEAGEVLVAGQDVVGHFVKGRSSLPLMKLLYHKMALFVKYFDQIAVFCSILASRRRLNSV